MLISKAVPVLVTSTVLDAGQGNKRKHVHIQNLDGTNPIFVAFGGAAATVTNGIKILAGASLIITNPDGQLDLKGAINAISTGGTVNTVFLEA